MTGSSNIGTINDSGSIVRRGLLDHAGEIEFSKSGGFSTLEVYGDYRGKNGSFILNTKLNEGGAASETDRIIVTGDASGSGLINVINNGGTGAFTGTGATDGIKIVEIGGASDAEFRLGSAAIIGIYDYQLRKADGQNWYLQTEGQDVINPPVDVVDPGDLGTDDDEKDNGGNGGDNGDGETDAPVTGHVADIIPGYAIGLAAAQNHVLTSLDTFHERLGELRAEELQDGYHAWMRGIGKTGSYSPKSITGYNGHGFDMTTAGVQIGADYSKSDVFVAGDKLTIGMFGEYANSSFDVRGRTADGSISSKGLGGYVTWQQKAPTDRKPGTGAYVDAVVKQDWLEFGVNAKSVSGFDLQNGYKGKATTASIETGYGFDLGNDVVLQPQAQLIWSKVKADSFTDGDGIAVHGQKAESLIGRVGVRLEKTFYFGDEEETVEAAPVPAPKAQKQVKGKAAKAVPAVLPDAPKKKKFVKSVTTYADANVKHEFKGKNGLVASNTGIGNDMGGTRYDVGVGVVARVSENVSLFGRGAVEFGGSTNVAGKVSGGLKISW
ncbi:autotransporter outer membrane beta-barrel domain-containing protein [Brucella anthropi]|uniref:autotransporter outer membrane beta-barrel domain-containing protein n=1 Tax=Brucella anthropi TaxID=529 RepID=UPI0015E44E07|nr:autotransporter outer membrane beta-barrel domain-containing protein [Ochrobactrum sp. MYb49]